LTYTQNATKIEALAVVCRRLSLQAAKLGLGIIICRQRCSWHKLDIRQLNTAGVV